MTHNRVRDGAELYPGADDDRPPQRHVLHGARHPASMPALYYQTIDGCRGYWDTDGNGNVVFVEVDEKATRAVDRPEARAEHTTGAVVCGIATTGEEGHTA